MMWWEDLADGNIGLMTVFMSLGSNPNVLVIAGREKKAFQKIVGERTGEELYKFLKERYPIGEGGIDLAKLSYDMIEKIYPSPKEGGGKKYGSHKARLRALAEKIKELPGIKRLEEQGYDIETHVTGKKAVNAHLLLLVRKSGEKPILSLSWYPGRKIMTTNPALDAKREVATEDECMAVVEELLQLVSP